MEANLGCLSIYHVKHVHDIFRLVASVVTFLISACDAVNTALIIVDVQNCFLPGSILAVADGEKVIPVINDIRDKYNDKMAVTVLTQVYMEPMERILTYSLH